MAETKINSAAPIQHDKNANFAHNEVDTASQVHLLPLGAIAFDENIPTMRADLDALCDSVEERGFDKPLMVRKIEDNNYEIIDGMARYMSAVSLGINTVPAIIVQMSDVEARTYRDEHDCEKRAQYLFELNLGKPNRTLCAIAAMMANERAINLEISELNRIADGLEMEDDSILVDRSYWFDHILESLNWWWLVSDTVLCSKWESGDKLCPEPAFANHREALLKLLDDTLTAFVPALQESHHFTADWIRKGEATRELLKKYRMYTRYVSTFAQEVWPDANMRPLLNRA
jgi:hypothetical protein